MSIYVTKDNQQSGPYEDHVIIDQLKSGMLSLSDLGIRQGETSWQSLGEMFPGVDSGRSTATSAPPLSVGDGSTPTPAPPAAKKGGCLKAGLIATGLVFLLLGIGAAAGSRFIPSVSCDLVESDAREIEKLRSDLDKATKNSDSDEVRTIQFMLNQELSGARASQENCDQDKLRDNIIAVVGSGFAAVGFLFAVIGFFVGRRK